MAKMIRSLARLSMLCLIFTVVSTSATNVNIGRTKVIVNNGTLNRPEGCTVDASGMVYIAEANAYVVRKLNPDTAALSVYQGTLNTPGHQLGSPALLSTPLALRLAPSGTTGYLVDFAAHNIYSVAIATGATSHFVGRTDYLAGAADGSSSVAELNQPWDVAVQTDGTLYATEVGAQRVRKILADGTTTHFSGTVGVAGYADGAATAAMYDSPHGVAVSATTVYVADTNNFVIRAIPIATQISTTLAGNRTQDCVDGPVASARFKKPWGLTLDRVNNYLYAADKGCNTIRRIDLTLMVVTTVVGAGADGWTSASSSVAAQISAPNGVCLDAAASKLYVTGANAVSVVRLGKRTATLTLAPGSNGTTTLAPTTTSGAPTTTTGASSATTTAAPTTASATTGAAANTTRAPTLPPTTTRVGGGTGNVTTSAPEDGSVSSAVSHAAVAVAAVAAVALVVIV